MLQVRNYRTVFRVFLAYIDLAGLLSCSYEPVRCSPLYHLSTDALITHSGRFFDQNFVRISYFYPCYISRPYPFNSIRRRVKNFESPCYVICSIFPLRSLPLVLLNACISRSLIYEYSHRIWLESQTRMKQRVELKVCVF